MQLTLWGIVIVGTIWLGGITFLLLKTVGNYNRLTRGVSEKTLSDLLNAVLAEEKVTQETLTQISDRIKQLDTRTITCIQKIGMVRFNPFADTGGDQSFALALLDGVDSGVVVTSLYSRSGVRWYIKTIQRGKGVEHELSKEEKEALKKGMSV